MSEHDDLSREIQSHLDLEAEEHIAAGLAAADAKAAARRAFGSVALVHEDVRALSSARWLEDVGRDAAYGIRALIRNPLFALAAMVTLGLGIGSATAVFSILNAVVLRPLP